MKVAKSLLVGNWGGEVVTQSGPPLFQQTKSSMSFLGPKQRFFTPWCYERFDIRVTQNPCFGVIVSRERTADWVKIAVNFIEGHIQPEYSRTTAEH